MDEMFPILSALFDPVSRPAPWGPYHGPGPCRNTWKDRNVSTHAVKENRIWKTEESSPSGEGGTAAVSSLDWLLETEDPSVRYRTLRELSGPGSAAEMLEAKRAVPGSAPARELLEAMHPDGYWLEKHRRTGRVIGDGVEYGTFDTSHFCLAYCAEMGLDKDHPLVAKAAERYLGLMAEDGDW